MTLVFREVALAFKRAPLLAMLGVTTIAFSLFAFGLFGLVALNIKSSLRAIEGRVEIRAFLVDSARDDQVSALVARIASMPEVAEVGYVSPDSALQRARVELDEFRDVIGGTVLPGSVELRLKEGSRDPSTVQAVARRVKSNEVVDEVRYGLEWVEKLYRIRTMAGMVGAALGVVFALVAVIIIGSTIRMAILARSQEIEIMRLVGATDTFVRRPYLIDGALKGLAGGLLAVLLSWMTMQVVSENLMTIQFFTTTQVVLGVSAGGALGLVASWLSVSRHLRRVWRDA